MEIFEREIKLLGLEKFEKLTKSNILVVGIGGVGGYVCEMLARCGIGNLSIVDFDTIAPSNINRQIIALHSTIGTKKTEAFEKRLLDINPNLNLKIFNERLTENNFGDIVNTDFDYVIDAIDTFENKISLICYCKNKGINIISAMGAGNRFGIPQYVVCDIYKTSNDGLAKKVRKELRSRGIKDLTVVCSTEPSTPVSGCVGSIAYQPSVCGITLASYVVNRIIKE